MRVPASGTEMPASVAISGNRLETTNPSVEMVKEPSASQKMRLSMA